MRLFVSVREGTALLDRVPEVVRNLVVMLIPAMNTMGAFFSALIVEYCTDSISGMYHVRTRIHRVNPVSHSVEDSYLERDVTLMLQLLQPLPEVGRRKYADRTHPG